MKHSDGSTGIQELWLWSNTFLIFLISLVLVTWRMILSIYKPINYKLDATKKEFCKELAEINNNLSFRRGIEGELYKSRIQTGENQQNIECASDLFNSKDSQSIGRNNKESASSADDSNSHTGSANHVYPNGWIPIMESSKVPPGSIKKAIIFGLDVIITRSIEGDQVNILDAYCPHMGVHIGISGQVKKINNESCVECPFHGWTFRASDGQCVKIPYSKCTIPKQAKLATWPCVEVDNFIYVWHHIDNQPPSWQLTSATKPSTHEWHLVGRSCHKTNLELRDMHENGADLSHFESIHNDLFIFGGSIAQIRPFNFLQKYTRHHWSPKGWKPILDELGRVTHMAEMKLQSWVRLLHWRLFDITVHATQIGPARVNLYYNSPWYGEGLLIMNTIPLGGRRTKYIQHVYTQRTLFQCFMAKWVFYGEIKMLERDLFIWNHKKNIKNPIFVQEDKTLKQFRLWYSQFYRRKQKITIRTETSSRQEAQVPKCSNSNIEF